MSVFLETERMLLRPFTPADVDALVELDADPEVMRFLTKGKPTPRQTIVNDVLPDRDRWAAIEKSTGDFLGWFGLRRRGDDERELGFRLRRDVWGKGYATEGSRALIAKCFSELGVVRVYAETMAVNLASRRVLDKAGLRHVRTFHLEWDDPIEGTELGEVEYEIRRKLA